MKRDLCKTRLGSWTIRPSPIQAAQVFVSDESELEKVFAYGGDLLADCFSSLVFGSNIFVIEGVYAIMGEYFKVDATWHFCYVDAVFRFEHTLDLQESVDCVC